MLTAIYLPRPMSLERDSLKGRQMMIATPMARERHSG